MPEWMHERAEHILAKNPSMPKSEAFAIATQQMHALGKSPKGYGTSAGKLEAKKKYKTPKDDEKSANPGQLESAKMEKKEAAEQKVESDQPMSPKKKMLLGLGGNVLGTGAQLGSGVLSQRAADSEMAQEGAKELFGKLKSEAKVPIIDAPHVSNSFFMPDAETAQKIVDHFGADSAARNAVKSIDRKGAVLQGGFKSPSVLAHELGHASIHGNRLGRLVQNKFTTLAGTLGAPVVGGLGGFASGFSDNENVQRAALAAPAILALPQLAYEAAASVKGLHSLHRSGASRKQLWNAAKTLAPAFGSYAAQAGTGVAGAAFNQGAASYGRQLYKEHKKKEAAIDELQKLGAVSDEQAKASLDRLESLEKSKPTLGQVGRYAGLGAITAPAMGLIGSAIAKKPYVHAGGSLGRVLASDAAKGALGMGAMPLLRSHLDRRAEIGTLKKYLAQPVEQPAEQKMAEFKLQGHLQFQGHDIAVENRKGSVRKGLNEDGTPWKTKMKFPYGYIKGTKGVDGEEVDVYVGPKKDAETVFVVHQKKDDGSYDEDKVMMGFESEEAAKKAYLDHYDDPKYFGSITSIPAEEFQQKLKERDGKKLAFATSQYSTPIEGPKTARPESSQPGFKTLSLRHPMEKQGFTQGQYGSTGGFVDFHQVSSQPGFRKPRLDVAVEKAADFEEIEEQLKEKEKKAGALTPGGLSPASHLASSRRIGLPKVTNPSGPSIGDIAKPKGPGSGTKIPGATVA